MQQWRKWMQLYLVDPDSVLLLWRRRWILLLIHAEKTVPRNIKTAVRIFRAAVFHLSVSFSRAGSGSSPPPILILSRCGQRIFSISSASGISSLFSLYALVVNFIYCIAIYNQTISHVYHSPVILIYAAAYIVNKKSKDIVL